MAVAGAWAGIMDKGGAGAEKILFRLRNTGSNLAAKLKVLNFQAMTPWEPSRITSECAMSPFSRLLSPISSLLSQVSFLSLLSRSSVLRLPPNVSFLQSHVSFLPSFQSFLSLSLLLLFTGLLSHISCLAFPVSCHTYPVSRDYKSSWCPCVNTSLIQFHGFCKVWQSNIVYRYDSSDYFSHLFLKRHLLWSSICFFKLLDCLYEFAQSGQL